MSVEYLLDTRLVPRHAVRMVRPRLVCVRRKYCSALTGQAALRPRDVRHGHGTVQVSCVST